MTDPDYEEVLRASLPPDAAPVRRGPGRPRGSKNKPKTQREIPSLEDMIAESEAGGETAETRSEKRDPELEALADRLRADFEQLDVRQFGTRPRILIEVLQDVSPSEESAEEEWRSGSRSIPAEIGKVPAARNLIDVVFCTGAESFRVVSVSPGKDFAFPSGAIKYGTATFAKPWLAGLRAATEAYKARLAEQAVGVRDVVVVIASDFCFGDDYRADLASFKAWAKANHVVVVAAAFGGWNEAAAAEFSDVPPVHLKDISLAQFFRVLSQSVSSASQTAHADGALASNLTRSLGAARLNLHHEDE